MTGTLDRYDLVLILFLGLAMGLWIAWAFTQQTIGLLRECLDSVMQENDELEAELETHRNIVHLRNPGRAR